MRDREPRVEYFNTKIPFLYERLKFFFNWFDFYWLFYRKQYFGNFNVLRTMSCFSILLQNKVQYTCNFHSIELLYETLDHLNYPKK